MSFPSVWTSINCWWLSGYQSVVMKSIILPLKQSNSSEQCVSNKYRLMGNFLVVLLSRVLMVIGQHRPYCTIRATDDFPGLMLNHTLTIMHWQIEVPSCRMGLLFIYAARVSQEFLSNAAIDVLLWPAKSSDISIIENIWFYISRRINCVNLLPRNDIELRAAVGNEWQSVTQARIRW